jgi:hypothetical protein
MLLHLGITSGVLAGASGEARAGDLPLAQHCHEGELRIEVPSSSVGRRAFALLQRAFDVRPSLTAVSVSHRRPSGPAYRVAVPASVVRARDRVRSQAQQPEGIEQDGADRDPETVALLRGVLLIGGSFSAPDRPAHLELSGVADDAVPLLLAALLQVLPELHAVHDAKRRRLVIKSGDAIADLLVALGATRAFLHLDDRRLRRQLRAAANPAAAYYDGRTPLHVALELAAQELLHGLSPPSRARGQFVAHLLRDIADSDLDCHACKLAALLSFCKHLEDHGVTASSPETAAMAASP